MTTILETQVTEWLTTALGRAPTTAEITNGIKSPWSLSNVHNTLTPTESILAVSPGDDLQAAVDKLVLNGGGILFLNPGQYDLTEHLVLDDNIHVQGVGSGGSIIDFGGLAKQIQIVGTAMNPVQSVFLEGFTVQNSTTDLIRVQYANNFVGSDVASSNGLSGISLDNVTIFNWSVGAVDSCGSGMILSNMIGVTVYNTFLSNITSGGGYVASNSSNSGFIDSSLDTVTGGGYIITNCNDFGILAYSVVNVTGVGILLDGCSNISISAGLVNNASGDGMKFQNSTGMVQVVTGTFTNNGGYGVNVSDAGSANNLFTSGIYSTNSSGAFHDLGTGTLIRSNIGVADN